MSRPRLLDLFCCAGGAAMGYHRAGFDVVGVDLEPQPNYPFQFVQADALTFPLEGFDVIHASPPCQAGLAGLGALNRSMGREYAHEDLVPQTRERLRAAGVPYVMEQPMKGARLLAPAVYCGSSFGLPIHRHRQFESNVLLLSPECEHDRLTEARYWTGYRPGGEVRLSTVVQVYGNGGDRHEWGPALGIDWMTPAELTQAIPPAYTEHIGRQLVRGLLESAA
jgi:DNA (cytosine-5)-methyltransferase 1